MTALSAGKHTEAWFGNSAPTPLPKTKTTNEENSEDETQNYAWNITGGGCRNLSSIGNVLFLKLV